MEILPGHTHELSQPRTRPRFLPILASFRSKPRWHSCLENGNHHISMGKKEMEYPPLGWPALALSRDDGRAGSRHSLFQPLQQRNGFQALVNSEERVRVEGDTEDVFKAEKQ